ncbi:uncharacterized protein LOC115089946 [Rhinatrema bivittatum]|uniref:uncharacterized protein LOC115089946 n=1 Tax=Rhinatrema bivittatum TaxID=194408 RepID=UPI00112BCD1F|nr:uncharacterized protein LOC115089946 [Rhinatrema bivittatum]XP_029454273.1 uncharacterized protein LOC115089946 [Rhinatrema bivittatum]XP_029454274.1 uncharacterized protein LOC115089946 [Rhinatrema bivittatum]XP_029454275.1 uncharacterized protein LOC115089946 [Rhinatrema bivittatum]
MLASSGEYFYTDQTSMKTNNFHHLYLRTNIPAGQFLRLRRLCGSRDEYRNQAAKMRDKFLARGYPGKTIKQAYKRGLYADRTSLLQTRQRSEVDRLVCVLPYTQRTQKIQEIILQHWHVLTFHESLQNRPLFARTRGRNLRDILVHSDSYQTDTEPTPGQYRCQGCSVCKHVLETKSFQHPTMPYKQVLSRHFDCSTDRVIYAILCPCQKLYIGQTKLSICTRIIQHRSCIHTGKIESPLVKHWQDCGHTEDQLKFCILQQRPNRRGGHISQDLRQTEQRFIYYWQTMAPKGLNATIEWEAFL